MDDCESPDVLIEVAAPVSMHLHPSGQMDLVFFDKPGAGQPKIRRTIRLNPLAASQFLDAIHAAVEHGHIHFDDEPVAPYLH
jgi:hypothetical protein